MNLSFLKRIIEKSKRPVILAGSGIAISNTQTELKRFVDKLSIPIATAWAHDIYPNHDKLYFGRQGSIGNRVGNFLVQYADLVIISSPLSSYKEILLSIKSNLKKNVILTDTGSAKSKVIIEIEDILPESIHFVPGHPIAGTEMSGPEAGFADLFDNRWCVLTPSKRTNLDKNRKNSPLIKVKDAILIRTDKLSKKQVLNKMSKHIDMLCR